MAFDPWVIDDTILSESIYGPDEPEPEDQPEPPKNLSAYRARLSMMPYLLAVGPRGGCSHEEAGWRERCGDEGGVSNAKGKGGEPLDPAKKETWYRDGGGWNESVDGERPYGWAHRDAVPADYEPPPVTHQTIRGSKANMWGHSHGYSHAITGGCGDCDGHPRLHGFGAGRGLRRDGGGAAVLDGDCRRRGWPPKNRCITVSRTSRAPCSGPVTRCVCR